MRYERVLEYVATTPWAATEAKLDEIVSFLAFRAMGGVFSADEIEARIGGKRAAGTAPSAPGVAVIPIYGTIAHRAGGLDESSGGTSTERIGAMLRQVEANDQIGTIVYDIDSPGGTVPGVSELAAQMFALRGQKRQIAHVNGMAASAAYWLAAQADEIVSIPSGVAGSIGVYSVHVNLEKKLEKEGAEVTVFKAGRFKTETSNLRPLSDEAKATLQDSVDTAYAQFVKDVARGRGVDVAAIRGGYGEGRALAANNAKAAGLIDRIESLDETLARVTGRTSHSMRAEADRFRYA